MKMQKVEQWVMQFISCSTSYSSRMSQGETSRAAEICPPQALRMEEDFSGLEGNLETVPSAEIPVGTHPSPKPSL